MAATIEQAMQAALAAKAAPRTEKAAPARNDKGRFTRPAVQAVRVAVESKEQTRAARAARLEAAKSRYAEVLKGREVISDRTPLSNIKTGDLFQDGHMARQGRWAWVQEVVANGRRVTLYLIDDFADYQRTLTYGNPGDGIEFPEPRTVTLDCNHLVAIARNR